MKKWLSDAENGLGRTMAWVALGAVGAGVLAFAAGVVGGDSPRAFAALIASWLFFAGAAAGALAFRAFFRIVDARWARPLAALGVAQLGFVPVVLVVLVVIVAGAGFAPWLHAERGVWLGVPFLAARELVLCAVLFGFAYKSLRAKKKDDAAPGASGGVVYCLLFAIILSVWAFDFVLGPDPTFQSTLIGPYVFMSAFIAGTGVSTLIALRRGDLGERERGDLGAFTLALAIFWGYLFWSQYLTIWYGNLPDEVAYAMRRDPRAVLAVVAFVFAIPFVTLLHPKSRRSARVLGGLVAVQLLGLWLNCQLMVVPSVALEGAPSLALRDVLIAVGMLGAFVLSLAATLRPAPASAEVR